MSSDRNNRIETAASIGTQYLEDTDAMQELPMNLQNKSLKAQTGNTYQKDKSKLQKELGDEFYTKNTNNNTITDKNHRNDNRIGAVAAIGNQARNPSRKIGRAHV